MKDIAKIDAPPGLRAFSYTADHPAMALWVHPRTGLLVRLATELARRKVHPARTVVLLPYAQLLPLASRLWADGHPDGFSPRFETTMNWVGALGGYARQPLDIRFDAGLDTLTAQALLVRAGLAAQQDVLAGMLVQSAQQLAPLAAAVHPDQRAAWAARAREAAMLGLDAMALQWEAAVARIAVEWAAASGYATDVLYQQRPQHGVDCLAMVQGLAPDPFVDGLASVWGPRLLVLPLAGAAVPGTPTVAGSRIALHECLDAEDEAQRSAACAIRHIAADRFPLALVSSDRSMTRRVSALLAEAGISMRDENGWKLSTSHCAAMVMSLLRAVAWHASSDAVLDWLKTSPVLAQNADALEHALRSARVRHWRDAAGTPLVTRNPRLRDTCSEMDRLRTPFTGRHRLSGWLSVLRSALQASNVWDKLLADGAGAKLATVLRLAPDATEDWDDLASSALWAERRMDLHEFTAWVDQALEGASFQPAYPVEEQVVILPMSQMLGRPFAALVMAGCDEVRLNPGAEPSGAWTAAQRAALGLPAREVLEALYRTAWDHALQTPCCDVLWRTGDGAGETVSSSSLVQLLALERPDCVAPGTDPRDARDHACAPVAPPQAVGRELPVAHLSASAYEDLRQCPYRFFALRQLGLQSQDELESAVDKRDYGLWLHAVLNHFHQALLAQPVADLSGRVALMELAASEVTRLQAPPQDEFLPFAAAWPAVRDGYLQWLADHEATGARFVRGELPCSQQVGSVKLVGRIDRLDQGVQGESIVLDYKSEPLAKTRARVKNGLEDTQIAFYAALLPDDTLRAAYVNVGERDGTVLCEQPDVVPSRDALVHGILDDMQRIAQGSPMPALGDGAACQFCEARGLCRKDSWALP